MAEPALIAADRLPERKEPQRGPWFWLAAALLHAAVIALCFVTIKRRPPMEAQSPPGVSVVFDKGGAQQETAPPAQTQGPPTMAQAPPPSSAPPPPNNQPQVRLDMPEMPLTALPAPAPSPQPAPQTRPSKPHNTRPTPHYLVMNNMSLGQPSPPMPNAKQGLNLQLSQSDLNAENGPELSIKGDIGADWDAELNQWVEDHKYYPDSAIEQNQQGNVRIHFTVDRKGNVTGLRMTSSSGSPFLDQAWLGLFQGAQLPAFPPGTKADTVTVDATMHFILLH